MESEEDFMFAQVDSEIDGEDEMFDDVAEYLA